MNWSEENSCNLNLINGYFDYIEGCMMEEWNKDTQPTNQH